MKMDNMNVIFWALLFVLGIGCNDEECLEPSGIAEYEIILPQGNHDYDEYILNWFERTGVYMLYKFAPEDVYFNVDMEWQESYRDTNFTYNWLTMKEGDYVSGDTVYVNGEPYVLGIIVDDDGSWVEYSFIDGALLEKNADIMNRGTFSVEEANETYVGTQLALFEDLFLTSYADSVLRSYMPLKVIFGKNLKTATGKEEDFRCVFNNLILSHGDESINLLGLDEKEELKLNLHMWFITEMLVNRISFESFMKLLIIHGWEIKMLNVRQILRLMRKDL